jgi:hypothetical protein
MDFDIKGVVFYLFLMSLDKFAWILYVPGPGVFF